MSGANSWLRGQRKTDLLELAETVGFKNTDGLKKGDLEVHLDEYLADNASQFSSDPKLAPYYNSRAKAIGSPLKKEAPVADAIKVAKRRATKAVEELLPPADTEASASTAVARTPGRALSLASRIPLPATPADISNAVDRGTVAIRERVASLYHDSGIPETTQATRESLSTVSSILLLISAFELYFLRPEVLADRYAFTIPAIPWLHTTDHPVYVPDMFLLLTSSFWSPTLLWATTSFIVPSLFGYFFNLSAANSNAHPGRGRPRTNTPEYTIDPLTFSIVKALLTYVVYAQGVTFNGWVDDLSVARINSALYGGWKGAITGTFVTALVSLYDAVLRK
ncbi:Cupin-type protein [Pleurostoma richardsiae]|uniref:Cupin-type protein n=1 Tax=Pleurostoma richardsiae TaxID=41990 RepID=A0AA38RTC5_9PEZI|nr:Cupin-type protein [Pleurostoma richardsiae]